MCYSTELHWGSVYGDNDRKLKLCHVNVIESLRIAWQFIPLGCRLVIEMYCAGSTDNYDAGLKAKCFTCYRKGFSVAGGQKYMTQT